MKLFISYNSAHFYFQPTVIQYNLIEAVDVLKYITNVQ